MLLVAVLEHINQPERVVDETHRVLKPDGEVAILVPNDFWMSFGRLLLFRMPPRHPGHCSWIPPGRIRRMAGDRFSVERAFALPAKWLPFELGMYYWTVLRKA